MTISNARLTPALDHYLIAVSKLVDDDHVVRMEHDGATVTKDGQTVLQVPCINGLYQYNEPERSLMSYNVKDWHSLFGHPSEVVLKVIQKKYPQFKIQINVKRV